MKYVPVDKEMAALLGRNGMPAFDPYRFDAAVTHDVIALLQGAREPEAGTATAPPVPQPALVALSTGGLSHGLLALAGLILLVIGFTLGKLAG